MLECEIFYAATLLSKRTARQRKNVANQLYSLSWFLAHLITFCMAKFSFQTPAIQPISFRDFYRSFLFYSDSSSSFSLSSSPLIVCSILKCVPIKLFIAQHLPPSHPFTSPHLNLFTHLWFIIIDKSWCYLKISEGYLSINISSIVNKIKKNLQPKLNIKKKTDEKEYIQINQTTK